MKSEEKLIEDFFQEMKEQDRGLEIPLSPVLKHSQKYNWLPLTVAASVLCFLVAYVIYTSNKPDELYSINIQFKHMSNASTETLLNKSASIDAWESPTESLIEDF